MKPGETYPESQQKQVVDWSFGPQKQMRNHCLPNKNKDFLDFFRYPFFWYTAQKNQTKTQKTDSAGPRCFFFWFKTRVFFQLMGWDSF